MIIAFLPRSKLFSFHGYKWPSAVILEPKKIKSVTVSLVSPLFAMKWCDWMPWCSFFECWVLSQLFHFPLSLSLRGSLVPLRFPAHTLILSATLPLESTKPSVVTVLKLRSRKKNARLLLPWSLSPTPNSKSWLYNLPLLPREVGGTVIEVLSYSVSFLPDEEIKSLYLSPP